MLYRGSRPASLENTWKLVLDRRDVLTWGGVAAETGQMIALVLLSLFLICYVMYVSYYRKYVVGPPELVCCDPERKRALEKHCPVLFQPFFPTIWATQAYMQTVGRTLLQTYPKHTRRRETVRMMSDGGHVCLDWYNELDPSQPTLVILPGLVGSSDENYVRHWIDDMHQQEYRCVVYNYRGCGNSKLSTTKLYCGANIEDLVEVLDHIRRAIPQSALLAVGVSLGSIQLIRYLSECKRLGKECGLKALLLISAIWDVKRTRENLDRFVNKHTLVRFLTFRFTSMMKENREVFEEAQNRGELCFNYHKAVKATTFEGISEHVIQPMFGYSSTEEWLEDWCPSRRLDGITIPVLAVNASDDPFCPPCTLPVREAQRNPNLILAVVKRGGHIGFMEGILPFGKCWMDKILVQFTNSVFEQGIP